VKITFVCFAVKEEAKFFADFAAGRPDLRLLLTGMGRKNAERSLSDALKTGRPDLVVSAGFAGGLRPGLATGTVLFAADAALEAALAAAGATRGRFQCAERVVSRATEKHALWQSTGADAAEMESEAICGLCRTQGIPCATVRAILDPVEEDLPLDFNRLLTTDLRLDPAKLALQLAKTPGKIPALLRLRRQSDEAARKLADALVKLFAAPDSAP
jgi:adenosylhomocysteine nucleosidase